MNIKDIIKKTIKLTISISVILLGLHAFVMKTSASWQPGKWITSSFWTQNPTNANIMYSLFGDGTPGASPYTKGWSSSCIPSTLTTSATATLEPGANSVIVLNSGTYTSSYLRFLGDCTSLIGSGKVTINLPAEGVSILGRSHIIIDNITFIGGSVYISGSSDITISNSTLSNTNASTNIITQQSAFLFFPNDIFSSPTSNVFGTGIRNVHFQNTIFASAKTGISLSSGDNIAISNVLFSGISLVLSQTGVSDITLANSQIYANSSYLTLGATSPITYTTGSDLILTGSYQASLVKQIQPSKYSSQGTLEIYGTDGLDYISSHFIGEGESNLSSDQESMVDTLYGSDSYFRKGRKNMNCSQGAFSFVQLGTNDDLPTQLQGNTIYLLAPGKKYSTNSSIIFGGNCIALLGSGNTIMPNTSTFNSSLALLQADTKSNLIISNITLDGAKIADAGIRLDNASKNNTIDNITLQNMGNYGIFLGQLAQNNRISNAEILNNNIGAEITYAGSENIITNSLIYNNKLAGISLKNGSTKTSISNTQVFNNQYGIFTDFSTNNNIITNTSIYNNNKAGISLRSSSNNLFANIRIYNNEIGIRIDDLLVKNNKYLGNNAIFANSGANISNWTGDNGSLTKGQAAYELGSEASLLWGDGILSLTGTAPSCNDATKPSILQSSSSIVSTTNTLFSGTTCTTQGQTGTWNVDPNISFYYTFGKNIPKQQTPVAYSGSLLYTLASLATSNKYIGENVLAPRKNPYNISFSPDTLVCGSAGCEARKRYTVGFSTYTGSTARSAQLSFDSNYGYGFFQVLSGSTWIDTGRTLSDITTLPTRIMVQAPGATGATLTGILTLSGTSGVFSGTFFLTTTYTGSSTGSSDISDIINSIINNNKIVDESKYTASNCKKYTIKYDSSRTGYTSPNLKYKRYFISRDALARFIDSGNPGGCQINTYEDQPDEYENTGDNLHITPNGRLYRIRFTSSTSGTSEGTYSSPDLIKTKVFTDLNDLRNYLDKGNARPTLREHTINEDSTPILYVAPNGKTYKIYDTDKGYMSYSFRTIKYYNFLSEIKKTIDKNNRK